MPSVIRDLHERLLRRETTAEGLLDQSLAAIRDKDETLHSFLHVAEDTARAAARRADEEFQAGREELPLLAGIPCAIKDMICVAGLPATAGSRVLDGFVPPYDATVIERLKDHDAVIVGKTNLDEFAMGSSTEHSAFGPTRNPYDEALVPGGSSGGSAAAVAANLVPYALGTDTGGSIRQPASFCGVVGLKPTYGRVSRYGMIAFASSFDQAGPLTRTVEDAAIVYEAIAGEDPRDGTTLPGSVPSVRAALEAGVQGLRLGVPEEYFAEEGVDPNVARTVRHALGVLAGLGAEVREVSLPLTGVALAVYYILATAEASTNLARYDGVRFGRRVPGRTLDDVYRRTRGTGFGAEVKRRILLGTFALSAGYADQYYRKAAAVRQAIAREYAQAFETVDILLSPATPEVAFRIGEKLQDPLRMYASDILSVPMNVAGAPALVVPCGSVDGLPVGLQIIAPLGREDLLFRVGAAYERRRSETEGKKDP
ncbi:MAG: aspartyl-tRNA(Asn)/glutamyl-tRNA (Gln) amidotransferase subunit A [Parcubacteria group bacterium Gr01-1014_38]|nr:MAG: aspartyl-tRNA(Asn)/glutamyl-tRNA (Gln) amidotransferase subunit A [Parcubacteria group bacterium Gr01-1014_38]